MKRAFEQAMAVALAASLSLSSVPAFADAWDAAMARAAAAKEKALDANDPASWEETLRLFQEADAQRATKESKYEVATAAAWLKQDDLAFEAYEEALALELSGPAKAKAEAFVAENAKKMGRLRVVGPSGARVRIDGRARGVLPRATPFVVFAGVVHLELEHAGKSSKTDAKVAVGEVATVDVAAAFAPPPAPTVTAAPAPAPAPVPEAPTKTGAPVGTALVIGGGALVVAGAVTWIVAANRVSHYDDIVSGYCSGGVYDGAYCVQMPRGREADLAAAQDASQSSATWRGIRTAGIIGLGVGAAAAIGGAILLLGKSSEKQTALRPTLSASTTSAFFGFTGAF